MDFTTYIFKRLCQLYFTPDIDLFATRINALHGNQIRLHFILMPSQ